MLVNLIGTLAVMLIVLAVTDLGGKADMGYVDRQDDAIKVQMNQQDAALEKKMDDEKVGHEKIHETQEKYLERIMDFWNIQYEDLKDELDEK